MDAPKHILAAHVTGACVTVNNKERPPPAYCINTTGCGCFFALKMLHSKIDDKSITADDASVLRYLAKYLVFHNRPDDALPYAQRALKYYQTQYGKKSIDALVMHAEVAFIYAMMGGAKHGIAVTAWRMLRERVSDFSSFPEADRSTAEYLIKHMGCDELIAKAHHEPDKKKRVQPLKTALEIALHIKHGYLPRICADLDILGYIKPMSAPTA